VTGRLEGRLPNAQKNPAAANTKETKLLVRILVLVEHAEILTRRRSTEMVKITVGEKGSEEPFLVHKGELSHIPSYCSGRDTNPDQNWSTTIHLSSRQLLRARKLREKRSPATSTTWASTMWGRTRCEYSSSGSTARR